MKFQDSNDLSEKRGRSGFTLIEVLVAINLFRGLLDGLFDSKHYQRQQTQQ